MAPAAATYWLFGIISLVLVVCWPLATDSRFTLFILKREDMMSLSCFRIRTIRFFQMFLEGIWPESESFKDENMGEIPPRWNGICQEGEGFNQSNCNRKIIGARWYVKGYEAEFGKLNTRDGVEFLSPRDAVGHGTHTSSTAAGGMVKGASFVGLAQGLARGGAPSAWLAIYKICWTSGGCSSADLLAAFDDAIFDGVDVISISLGSSLPLSTYVDDIISIGSFHAVAKGISVVCSAGNSGPYPQKVTNTAPWL